MPWLDGGDAVLVIASEDGRRRRLFLVPRDAAGLVATPERNMGIDALPTVELALDGVRVPATTRWRRGRGIDCRAADQPRPRRARGARPSAWRARPSRSARDYAKERETFGAPIATQAGDRLQARRHGHRDRRARACWSGRPRGASTEGGDATRETTLASQQAARVALEVADGAVQVLGGHGYIRDYLPEMHLRNARGFASFEAP